MAITKAEVEKIAKLAKLKFTEDEKEKLTEELAQIIAYVEKLDELDLENVAPTPHVLNLKNIMRDDEVRSGLSQEEALMNAPARHSGFFSVPKVITVD
ncbi:MAG: Asp-tRNA(Asn)/Glu-tRNA(Gln) amidotransferase subunit GatC [bacterium]|nr:MAG: Asp-tRNA(Asn)/Glu-tRNA(Gln) amidotransferase subunit GatC [bacterium]